jgi:GTP-binding protein EngB required for normal cell division
MMNQGSSASPSKSAVHPKDEDDRKTEVYLEDLQHLVLDAKNQMADGNSKLIIEMNLKLREDLTKAFESYITLLTKCDKLHRDKIQ